MSKKNGGDCVKAFVRVHRPTLTEEEREARMKLIKDAAVRLLLEAERAKRTEKATTD